jgi:dihydrofolate reductase
MDYLATEALAFIKANPAWGGGANAARQYLLAGLVDEMEISLVPTLLGSGERLFEGTSDDLHCLVLVKTVAMPKVVHLKFARR